MIPTMQILRAFVPFLVSSWGLVACATSSSPPPQAPAPSPAESSEPNTPSEAAPSSQEPAEGAAAQPAVPAGPTEPYAEVIEILEGKHDPEDRRARIEFFNPTNKSCRFEGYKMRWGESEKQMPLGNVRIPARNSRQRFLLLHPYDGDLESLTAEDATIELQVVCHP